MTILNMYSVRDVAAGTFGTPFFSNNDMTATRSVSMEVNNADARSVLHTNPSDFELYRLGSFSDETGLVSVSEHVELMFRLDSLVEVRHES